MNQSRKNAKKSLIIVIIGTVLAWLSFVAAQYSDLKLYSYGSYTELTAQRPEVEPSIYFIFLAITVLAVMGLIAKHNLRKNTGEPGSRLTHPVDAFASVAIIVALALAAMAAIVVFLGGFNDQGNNYGALYKTINVYLPIILYTVLVIGVLLSSFIFIKKLESAPHIQAPDADQTKEEPTKLLALAWSVPIITVAVALIIGLIVYDVTGTSLDTWIWALIAVIVGSGIVLGTLFAVRALRTTHEKSGLAFGAQNLNFILSILFVITATLMSLGFGSSAINQLRLSTSYGINVSGLDGNIDYESDGERVPLKTFNVYADGSDIPKDASVTVWLEPDGRQLFMPSIDRYQYFFEEEYFDFSELDGEYQIVLLASKNGDIVEKLEVSFFTDGEWAVFKSGTSAYDYDNSPQILKMTLGWFFAELLAAFMLLAIAMAAAYLTLTIRNRDSEKQVSEEMPASQQI